jgi:hypothetical protein
MIEPEEVNTYRYRNSQSTLASGSLVLLALTTAKGRTTIVARLAMPNNNRLGSKTRYVPYGKLVISRTANTKRTNSVIIQSGTATRRIQRRG